MPNTKPIPLVDLVRQYRSIETDIRSAIDGVLERGVFILGDEVRKFEKEFADYCGADYGIGVGNGTSALMLALLGLGVGLGDEVIVPVNTFIATAEAVAFVGATPVFVDASPETFNLDLECVRSRITAKTKGIIAVHLYGQPVDMDALLELARPRGLFVLEDAAQAHGASYKGRSIGALADAACFSFFPAKNLGAFGDAGMVVTSRKDIADFVAKYRDHGRTEKYVHERLGVNTRLDELHAAVLRVKLRYLSDWVESRRHVAEQYRALLDPEVVTLPPAPEWSQSAYHLFVIQCANRDGLRKSLGVQGIAAGVHYPLPLHLQPAFAYLGLSKGSFPVAERMAESILSLPIFAELTDEEVARVSAGVNSFLREGVLAR